MADTTAVCKQCGQIVETEVCCDGGVLEEREMCFVEHQRPENGTKCPGSGRVVS